MIKIGKRDSKRDICNSSDYCIYIKVSNATAYSLFSTYIGQRWPSAYRQETRGGMGTMQLRRAAVREVGGTCLYNVLCNSSQRFTKAFKSGRKLI